MGVKNPRRRFDGTLTDVGTVQFTTTMAYYKLKQTDDYNSGAKTSRSVIFRRQITRALKRFVSSFTQKIPSAELVLCCFPLDLFVLQTLTKSMPREAKKRNSVSGDKRTRKQTSQLDVQPHLTDECRGDKMLELSLDLLLDQNKVTLKTTDALRVTFFF